VSSAELGAIVGKPALEEGMNVSVMVSVLLILAGCTSMKPVATETAAIEQHIASGDVAVGDDVEIVTVDDQRHRFRVTAVDAATISGDGINVPIESIVGLKTREFSYGKSAGLAGGVTLTMIGLFLLAASSMVFMAP
jgi:hypothetical protein